MQVKSRLAALCALTFALCACGGGGTTTPAPAPPKTTLTITTQRNAAQAALAAEFGIGFLTLIFGNGTSQSFGGASTVGPPPCNNGLKVSIVTTSTTIVTTLDAFYEPTCITILAHVVLTQTMTSATTSTLGGTATFTSLAGAVLAYNTLSGSVTKSGGTTAFSVTGTIAPNQSAPAVASFGLSCSATATTNSCGFGGLQNVSLLNTEFGNTFSFSGTQSGNVTSGAATLQGYTSALSAMTLAPSGTTSWTITGGGAPIINDSGTFSVTVGPFNLASAISVSLSDTTADANAVATMSGGPFGATGGSVTQISNGITASTLGLDGLGFGTITYSDATSAQIAGFVVQ
jgi:hypothetical protein